MTTASLIVHLWGILMSLFGLFVGLALIVKPGKGITRSSPEAMRFFHGHTDVEAPSFKLKMRVIGLMITILCLFMGLGLFNELWREWFLKELV